MKNDELLHKWFNDTLSAEELELFKLRPEYQGLQRVKEQTVGLELDEQLSDLTLKTILASKKEVVLPKKEKAKSRNLWMPIGIAASVLLVMFVYFWPSQQNNNVELAATKTAIEERLPDGSQLKLKPGAIVKYDKADWMANRIVHLTGEANFSVKKGNNFKVLTDKGFVQVLGTQFDVSTNEDHLLVACQSGKVAVYHKEGQKATTLEKGENCKVYPKGKSISYTKGFIAIKKFSLDELITIIEQQYQVSVVNDKHKGSILLSSMLQTDSLEEALKVALTPLNISFEIDEDIVRLK